MKSHTGTRQRVSRWRATGIHRTLWPGINKAALTRAHDAIWDATARVLTNDGTPTLRAGDVGGKRVLSIATMISGMGGLLGYWVDHDRIACDDETAELLRDFLDHGRRSAYKMETALTDILAACRTRSITPTVLKGTYTARRYFPEPGTRPSADIDLLVRPEDLAQARAALTATGFEQSTRPNFGTEVWKPAGATNEIVAVEMEHVDNPWSIDLHTSIDRPYFRGHWSHFGRSVFAITERWIVRQQQALVFGQPLLLAHLAQHASRDIVRLRIVRLVELILVIRQDKRIRWNDLLQLLNDSQVTRYIYPAFALAEKLAPGTVDAEFLATIADAAPRRVHRAVRRLSADPLRSFFRRSPSERLMWTDGFYERMLGWSDVIWPTGHAWPEKLRIAGRRMRMLAGR